MHFLYQNSVFIIEEEDKRFIFQWHCQKTLLQVRTLLMRVVKHSWKDVCCAIMFTRIWKTKRSILFCVQFSCLLRDSVPSKFLVASKFTRIWAVDSRFRPTICIYRPTVAWSHLIFRITAKPHRFFLTTKSPKRQSWMRQSWEHLNPREERENPFESSRVCLSAAYDCPKRRRRFKHANSLIHHITTINSQAVPKLLMRW